MDWWHTPFVRIYLANGGAVRIAIIMLIWLGASIFLGVCIGRSGIMRIRYHSVVKWTAVFGIFIGLILGFAVGCIFF